MTRLRRTAVGGASIVAAAFILAGCAGTIGSTTSVLGTAPVQPPPPAVPHPFGKLTCTPRYGIRFCPGGFVNGQDLRVPSFDGVPLDADVALPATGRGPFPLVVLLHGLGGSKTEFEVTSDDGAIDDVTMADHGYAVLMYTARGFGTSCGTVASRAHTPACAKGWIQLADQRYEVRDTQYLAGRLVDEGLVKPDIAVAGVSYGAGQSLELAMLKDRTRLVDGRLVPFTSPRHHVPMAVAAVYAMWPWDDLVTALDPNGALTTTRATPASADLAPPGVAKQSWDTLLYAVTTAGYLAPPGADPQADLTTWYHDLMAGEPYSAPQTEALRIIQKFKSAIGVPMAPGGPAPTAIQSGWTDTLFPVTEALHYAARVRSAHEPTPMLLMFDDVGHGWAQGKAADVADTNARAIAFLDAVMLSRVRPPTGTVVIPQTCLAGSPSGAPATGSSLRSLERGHFRIVGTGPQTVTSSGGNPQVSAKLNAAYTSPLCDPLPAATGPGTAVYGKAVGPAPVTLLGGPRVTARLHVAGNYPELVARLWDVAPDGSRQIVALGVMRPPVAQARGTATTAAADTAITFQLNPNEYTFAAGHTIELELVGSTAPLFRKSNGTFTLTVSHLMLTLPTR
ncbi:MAG: CocE/NonD family hydrolase C-terminal non-catalytic domain-containing protein [Acidimicrobiales bacterium]